jgi:hypothetical protein
MAVFWALLDELHDEPRAKTTANAIGVWDMLFDLIVSFCIKKV